MKSPDRPRVPLGGAPDHDGGGAGGREHGLRLRLRRDVAGGHDRDVDELDELGRQRLVGLARVHLLGRARMQGQRGGPGVDQARPELEAGARAVLEAATHLHRHRDGDSVGH